MASMLRVRTVWTGVAGTPWYTNLYFDGTGSTDATAAAAAWRAFLTGFSFQFSSQITAQIDPFVAQIDAPSGDITGGYTIATPAGVVGQETGAMLPTQTQSLTTLYTPLYVGGRNIKGRVFLPAYTEAANDFDGTLLSSYATALEAEWATLLGTGPDLLVYSRKNGTDAPVSAATVSTKWSVLRSRRD